MSDGVRDGRERDGQVLIKMNYQLQEHDAYPGVVVLASTHHLSFDVFLLWLWFDTPHNKEYSTRVQI